MSNKVSGIVAVIKKHPSGFYSVSVADQWFGAGKYAPKFGEGDVVEFTFTENGDFKNLDFKSVKIIEESKGEAPKKTTEAKATDWDRKDQRITWAACRNSSIAFTDMLVNHGAVKLPATVGKKEEVLFEIVAKYTKEFYNHTYVGDFDPEEV